jgi:sterol desaturase/sphingolipid hydroxylase (fatty acid hydroxylase superfamily)
MLVDVLSESYALAQQWLFEVVVQPAVFALGGGSLLEDAFAATGWLLVGLVQILILLLLIGPLERWRPFERITDRAAVRVDVIYTLLHRLGVIRVALFFLVDPFWDGLWGWLAVQGVNGWQIDALVAPWWPGVTDTALAGFFVYLVVFDLADYGLHRAQHRFDWWWALHALHHSQRQMTMWSDSRNHLLDMLIVDALLVQLGHAIGMAPGQFVAVVAVTQLVESLSHANVRLSFGRLGERLLVGPVFHRLHHGIGIGHESAGQGTLGGHNFGVLFPWWDQLFGTARFGVEPGPTGIRDQLPQAGGRDYGQGFWAQQRLGLLRLFGRA